MLVTYLIFGSLLAFACWLAERVTIFWKRKDIIKAQKCEAPPSVPDQGFLGFRFLLRSYESIKKHSYLNTARVRFETYGTTYEFRNLGARVINTIDPENVRTVLSTKFDHFSLGPRRKQAFDPLIGHGIFTADKDWDSQRKLLRPHFSKDHIIDVSQLDKHVNRLLENIPLGGEAFDIQDQFFRFTIDTATEFLMGQSTESLLACDKTDEFAASFDRAQRTIANRFCLGKLAFLMPQMQFRKDSSYVQKRADDIVRACLSRMQDPEKSGQSYEHGQSTFLDELTKVTQDRYLLRSAILNLLVAGRDTTASLLSNLWFVLARKPEVWKKLQDEIASFQGAKPTYEQLKDLKYLRQCINESLRLNPPIPINTRTCIRDAVLPVGGGKDGLAPILVKKGDMVGYQVYSMHRQEKYFGSDPESFIPERWETIRPGWAYLPFNGGPRLCLGQQYALTEASYLSVRLLQAFSDINPRDTEPWAESLTLSCSSKNGTQISLTAKEKSAS